MLLKLILQLPVSDSARLPCRNDDVTRGQKVGIVGLQKGNEGGGGMRGWNGMQMNGIKTHMNGANFRQELGDCDDGDWVIR